jgi:hypothetical protein
MVFEDIPELKLPKEMLDLAAHIVETKSGHIQRPDGISNDGESPP